MPHFTSSLASVPLRVCWPGTMPPVGEASLQPTRLPESVASSGTGIFRKSPRFPAVPIPLGGKSAQDIRETGRSYFQDSGRKNSLISCASAAGCSSAAKCPPFGMTLQRRTSNTRSAAARGGRRISRGNSQ
jgi:hypothetical protein